MESTEYLVDTHELTRLGQTVDGQVLLSHFKRLGSDLPPQGSKQACWSVRGQIDRVGQQTLEVSVSASVTVTCQRCMKAMECPVASSSTLHIVQSEAELDALEDQQDADPDDWIEPVLASNKLNALELVEDELILGLPYVPMHDACSHDALASQHPDDADGHLDPSPFAVLTQLKKK